MKNKKILILIVGLIGILLFTTSCRDKIEETVGNKITENIIEKATDEDVDVDLDSKDGLSVETEGGSMKTGENLKWPKDSMGSLPEPEANVVSITEIKEGNSTSVIVNFDKKGAGSDYMQKLIDLGYAQITLSKNQDFVSFSGAKEDDNTLITFNFNPNETQASITIARNNDASKDFFERENNNENKEEPPEIDMSESMDWPKDSMDNIPRLEALITSVSLNANITSIGYEGLSKDEIMDYIEEIKDLGYDINSSEMLMTDLISYRAANDKGNTISVNWRNYKGNLIYTRE